MLIIVTMGEDASVAAEARIVVYAREIEHFLNSHGVAGSVEGRLSRNHLVQDAPEGPPAKKIQVLSEFSQRRVIAYSYVCGSQPR